MCAFPRGGGSLLVLHPREYREVPPMGSVFHQLLTLWCHDFGLSAQNYELWILLFVKYPRKIHCQGSGSG